MTFALYGSVVVVNDTNANAYTDLSISMLDGQGLIIGTAIGNNTSTITSITITGEANATAIGTLMTAAGQRMQLFYLSETTSTATKDIHITYSAFSFAYSSFAIAIDAPIALDDNDQIDTDDTLTLTASEAGTFGVSLAVDGNAEPTTQSGFTLVEMLNVNAYTRAQYDVDLGASGSKTIEQLGTVFQGICAAIFKTVGGGGATYFPQSAIIGAAINRAAHF